MKYIKTYESWNSESEFVYYIVDILKERGLSPVQIRDIVNSYSEEMINYFYDGKSPSDFINKELENIKSDIRLPLVKSTRVTNYNITYK